MHSFPKTQMLQRGPAWAIAKREWLLQVRDPKLPLFAILIVLLLPLSVYVNTREYGTQRRRATELQNRVMEDARIRGGKLTGRDIEPALRVVRVPSQGFVFVRGIQAELPAYWDVGPAGVRAGPPADGYLTPAGQANLDVEFMIRMILGLYPLLLGIESLALERERKTLQALMAHPVSNLTILGGKLLAAVAILGLTSLGLGLLLTLWIRPVESLAELGHSTIPSLCFGAFWYLLSCYLLGLALSHVGGGFQRTLTIGLGTWLFLNVVSLPLAGSVSGAVVGQRPRSDFEGELQRAHDATLRESERRLGTELLERAPRRDWLEMEKDPTIHSRIGVALEPVWREYATHWAMDVIAREAHWYNAAQRQDRLNASISLLSPGLAFHRFASSVSGTSAVNGLGWHEAVVTFQATLYNALFGERSRLTLRVPMSGGYELLTFQRRDDLNVAELPVFRPPVRASGARPAFLVLFSQCVFLLVISAALFARVERT